MPYINPDKRAAFDSLLDKFHGIIWSGGELNYVITRLVDDVLASFGGPAGYEDYNAMIGVLECAKLELYRRRVAPYEDKKMLENGDVFRYNEETESHD